MMSGATWKRNVPTALHGLPQPPVGTATPPMLKISACGIEGQ